MKTSPIEIFVPLKIAPAVVRDSALRVMESVGKKESPYKDLVLSVKLRDLHVAAPGDVQVPIDAQVVTWPGRWECSVRLHAITNERFFPTFTGTISVTPIGNNAELWLQGTYEPPLGTFGAALNALVLHGAAENSLRMFLRWLASEIAKDVRANEERHERDLRAMHS